MEIKKVVNVLATVLIFSAVIGSGSVLAEPTVTKDVLGGGVLSGSEMPGAVGEDKAKSDEQKKFLDKSRGNEIFLSSSSDASGNSAMTDPVFQTVHYVINSNHVETEDEYATLNYNGHLYAPIRFIANQISGSIDYDAETSTVTLNTYNSSDPCQVIGPKVTPDQAKIVAYETYHLVHVDEQFILRILSDQERKQIPPDDSDLTPVYYFITGTDRNNQIVTICVSSNSIKHHFIIVTPK